MCYSFSVTEEPTKRKRGRPPTTGVTPGRHIRVGAIWEQAEELAKNDGENMPALVTRLLTEYVEGRKKKARPKG